MATAMAKFGKALRSLCLRCGDADSGESEAVREADADASHAPRTATLILWSEAAKARRHRPWGRKYPEPVARVVNGYFPPEPFQRLRRANPRIQVKVAYALRRGQNSDDDG